MVNMGQKLCKICKESKRAQYSHVLLSGNMIFIDEVGRQWKGQVCPDCQSARRQKQRKGFKSKK